MTDSLWQVSDDPLTDSREKLEALGANMSPDGYELCIIRYILNPVWKNLPEQSLSDLFDTCTGREDNDLQRVLWYIVVALLVSKSRNPGALCRYLRNNHFRVDDKEVLYKIRLVEVALEIASNTSTCKTFIQHVMAAKRLLDKKNYLPEESRLKDPNDMVPYLLKLFVKLEDLTVIGPLHMEPLKEFLKKKQLNKAAQMVDKPEPLHFSKFLITPIHLRLPISI